MLSLSLIDEAQLYLKDRIRQTPQEYSSILSNFLGVPVYLKLEFFQITGSFKVRGAFFRLSRLNLEEKSKGVITCSAGNHGKAVAYVAKQLGIKATIYVPKDVDKAKYEGIVSYGAEVVRSDFIGYDDTELLAKETAAKEGCPFISAFDDHLIMAANGGTLAKEVMGEFPNAETFILPVGGGGLAAGFSYYVKEKNKSAKIIGCQHVDSASLYLSLKQKKAVLTMPPISTVAGGIEGGVGEQCFEVLKDRISEVALVTEKEIYDAFCWMLEHHQYLIEPSATPPIAAILHGKIQQVKGPVVIILSGRNVSFPTIKKLIGSQ